MLNRISIDGHYASMNEATFGMDWFIHDQEVDKAAHTIGGKMDTLILGAATYRLFEHFWVPVLNNPDSPSHMKETAEELTSMNKVVFSRTIHSSNWSNTQFYDGEMLQIVRQLKSDSSSDILVLGSGSIVQQLAEEGLIDEFIFIVSPIVAGEGKPLFKDVSPFPLTPVEAKTFESGNIILHYRLKQ